MTDTQIRQIVADVLEREECWADALDRALTDAGVELHSQQPDGSRMQDIVRLADGRMVRLADESEKGYLQYRIESVATMEFTLVTLDRLGDWIIYDHFDSEASARAAAGDREQTEYRICTDLSDVTVGFAVDFDPEAQQQS